jgi:zinc and cadmium transporter
MDTLIVWIVAFTALGGALSVLAAGIFLLLPESTRVRMLPALVSFAIGAMLGATFIGLLPEALEAPGIGEPYTITLAVLLGLLAFFLLEKLVIWRHCHADECEVHGSEHHRVEAAQRKASGYFILLGDGIHNLVDGVLIAAAFLADVQLGILTGIAVIAHEVPQEVGDFAVLLHSGYGRGKALWYNLLSSLTSIVGGVAAYFSLSHAQQVVPYVLAIAASSFIYIAVADLIPGLHKRTDLGATVQQVSLILLGVGVIALADAVLH